MKKKFVRIICWTIAIALLCTAVWFLCAFFGNPVSSALAKSTAKRYLEENYPDVDFIIEKVSYDMKSGGYLAHVESPTSIDSHFTDFFIVLSFYFLFYNYIINFIFNIYFFYSSKFISLTIFLYFFYRICIICRFTYP